MALARDIGPRKCYFIHMSHEINYETDGARLDPWMEFSHDGMKVEI
jgi:phosphoribosyl 1,2-cyclic phosphodiesterase